MQEALELRQDAEELAEQSRRLYEEANEIVQRLRRLRARTPPASQDGAESCEAAVVARH